MRILYITILMFVCVSCSKENVSAPESPANTMSPITNGQAQVTDFSQFPKVILEAEMLSSEVDSALVMRSSSGKRLPCQWRNITRIKILSPKKYAGEAQIHHPRPTVDKRWINKGESYSIRMLNQHTLDFWAESKNDDKRNVMLFADRFEILPNKGIDGDSE